MLWQTSTGGRPVASVTRRTASSMALAYHQSSPARAPDSRPHAHGPQRADVRANAATRPGCTSGHAPAPRPCARRLRRQPVGRAAPPQRLAPAKINRAAPTLMPPRPKQLRCGGQRHGIAPVEALHEHQLDSQHRRQPPQRQQRHQHRPQAAAATTTPNRQRRIATQRAGKLSEGARS